MSYPPKFAGEFPDSGKSFLYPHVYDLDTYDVFIEDNPQAPVYFTVDKLPATLSFGKTFFTIAFTDPQNSPYRLREGSTILFEFKDRDGTVIFSDLTNLEDVNGAAVAYVWVKEDPLSTYKNIVEGRGSLTIVGELDNVPAQYRDVYNVRLTIPVDIRKNIPNTTPVLFQSASHIQKQLVVSESQEFDDRDFAPSVYKRSLLNISASHLHTFGGQVRFAEVYYKENSNPRADFKILAQYEVSSSGDDYEITGSSSKGLNPISNLKQVAMPRELRRSGSVDFRIRFLDNNKQSVQDFLSGE